MLKFLKYHRLNRVFTDATLSPPGQGVALAGAAASGLVMTLGEGPLRGLRGEAGAGHVESWPLPRSVGLFAELSCAGQNPGETSGKYCILCARCDSSSWSPTPPWGSEPPRRGSLHQAHVCAGACCPSVAGQEHATGTFLTKARALQGSQLVPRGGGALSTPRVCD